MYFFRTLSLQELRYNDYIFKDEFYIFFSSFTVILVSKKYYLTGTSRWARAWGVLYAKDFAHIYSKSDSDQSVGIRTTVTTCIHSDLNLDTAQKTSYASDATVWEIGV